jgi:hypothetical protein
MAGSMHSHATHARTARETASLARETAITAARISATAQPQEQTEFGRYVGGETRALFGLAAATAA